MCRLLSSLYPSTTPGTRSPAHPTAAYMRLGFTVSVIMSALRVGGYMLSVTCSLGFSLSL